MSRQPILEPELDEILRSYLHAATPAPSERVAEGAVARVRATRQVRRPLVTPWTLRHRLSLLPTAAVAAAVLVAIGALVVLPTEPTAPSPTATPTPSPTSTPSPPPTDQPSVLGSAADGYSMDVPPTWTELPRREKDTREWEGPEGTVMVSYGRSILDGGYVQQCGPPTSEWPPCSTESYGYSVPFDPDADGVGPLDLSGYVRDRCLGGCDVTTRQTQLGGEDAQENVAVAGDQRVTYISTFHDRRPVIVYWSESASGPSGADRVDLMRSSFRFLDAAVASPTPFVDPMELVPYVDTARRYELLVPRFWGEGRANYLDPDVREFGAGRGFGTRGHPAMTITVGEPDGRVTLCQDIGHVCEAAVATTHARLGRLLVSVPDGFVDAVPPEASGDLVLAGAAGRFKRPGFDPEPASPGEFGLAGDSEGGNCLGCPGMQYHAYAVVDGRPVVISIDWWTIEFGELPADYLGEILSSFRLRD